jgi:SAM-dependent methyltransferase
MNDHNAAWMAARPQFVAGRLLEVGSLIVVGQEKIALRHTVEPMVDEYVGLDMREGNGVDVVANAVDMPFPDNSFDTLVSFDMLEHAQWPREVIRECGRVMKPGAYFFLATVFDFPIHDHPSDYWRFTPECLKLLVEDAGLEVFMDLTPAKRLDKPMVVKVLARKPDA